MANEIAPPKMFISYSWSSAEHQDFVLRLAEELVASGIYVTLDKWDLKEGHDAHAFMERMVSDPEIRKVGIISDRKYAEKADARVGGVGVEAQIITPEIYSKQDQNKFVAIVVERKEDGSPWLPVYYKSRIYIDLSEENSYATEFEKLVRWVFDKPLFVKPAIGNMPAFLAPQGSILLATSLVANRALDAVKSGRQNALAAFSEYLTVLGAELAKLKPNAEAEHFDEEVIRVIDAFHSFRDEYISIVSAVAVSNNYYEGSESVHNFLESVVPYMYPGENQPSWKEWDFDGYNFIIHEIYLYSLAIFIGHKRFDAATRLMADLYVTGRARVNGEPMQDFTLLRNHMRSLDYRNKRLSLNRLSLRADLLKARNVGSGVKFDDLMQADFILYLRSAALGLYWWPETMLYFERYKNSLEIFARSKSAKYFQSVVGMLAVHDKSELSQLIEKIEKDKNNLPRWSYRTIEVREIVKLDVIGSQA